MRRLLPLLLIVVATAASAQAYKWKDASGTVHYSDTPPPTGTDYKNVKTTGSTSPLGPSAVPTPSSSAAKPSADAGNKSVCTDLQKNMALLSGTEPLSIDGPNGKQVALDDTHRRQELSLAQDQYKQNCAK
ncbi:DUF4124 domain-containing protein [Pinirhizobacter soli]|uniref:DUF4124 domain-containing protein n=1 Tax=Pinirhizobacter soli TaxID=2786953 RepID=UPI002029D4A1|nr:DUF4124 domain-containing protein [Pinirhizobacter soli]